MSYIPPSRHPLPKASSYSHTQAKPEPFAVVLARVLDRQADTALQHGYRLQAERLAHRAAEMREAAR